MRPVASTGTSRVTKTDMVIGGHLIPGNSFIVVPFDAVHHWAGNWPDQPHAFIPVRPPALQAPAKKTCLQLLA